MHIKEILHKENYTNKVYVYDNYCVDPVYAVVRNDNKYIQLGMAAPAINRYYELPFRWFMTKLLAFTNPTLPETTSFAAGCGNGHPAYFVYRASLGFATFVVSTVDKPLSDFYLLETVVAQMLVDFHKLALEE